MRPKRISESVPADWHPHALRNLPPESPDAETARRVDERAAAMLAGQSPSNP